MKAATRTLMAAALGSLALAAPGGAKLVTWETASPHVDAAKEPMGTPADGGTRPPGLRTNVYVPDGYDGRRCRPVLYLMHGGFGGYDYWAAKSKLDVLSLVKDFEGFIVMPESGGFGGGINYWNSGRRGDPAWASYHLDQLVPLVEQRLEVCPGRRNHTIGGYSAGGLTAMLHAAARPGYFGAVASFSGVLSPRRPEFWSVFSAGAAALWPDYFATEPMYKKIFGDPVAQSFYWDGHDPTKLVENLRHTRLFLSHGDGVVRKVPDDVDHPVKPLEAEVKLMAGDFMAAADRAGVAYHHVENPGVHDYPYFKVGVGQAAKWGIFSSVEDTPDRWTYRTVATSGRMWDLEFRFAQPPETLQAFTRSDDQLRATGSGTVTVRTAGGCEFSATLPFDRELPDRCRAGPQARIQLSVRPRRVPAGRRTRFVFLATTSSRPRRPVSAAIVRFAEKSALTNRLGRAEVVTALRAGRHRARASRSGLRTGTASVTATRRPRFAG